MSELLVVRGLRKTYRRGGKAAVDGVDLDLSAGQALGLVGESGSGKSTTARLVNALETPDAGSIHVAGIDVLAGRAQVAAARRVMQMVFQDPYSSLDPRMSVAALLREALVVHRLERTVEGVRRRSVELLEQVGLDEQVLGRHPRSLSGGQRQRIAIARALAVRPQLLICDEPVSSLDVSVQAQVLNLLRDLREQVGVAVLFIAHDLAVVRYLCERVAVMQAGCIVETGDRDAVFGDPHHPYTRALLAAVPIPDPVRERERRRRDGSGPSARPSSLEQQSS